MEAKNKHLLRLHRPPHHLVLLALWYLLHLDQHRAYLCGVHLDIGTIAILRIPQPFYVLDVEVFLQCLRLHLDLIYRTFGLILLPRNLGQTLICIIGLTINYPSMRTAQPLISLPTLPYRVTFVGSLLTLPLPCPIFSRRSPFLSLPPLSHYRRCHYSSAILPFQSRFTWPANPMLNSALPALNPLCAKPNRYQICWKLERTHNARGGTQVSESPPHPDLQVWALVIDQRLLPDRLLFILSLRTKFLYTRSLMDRIYGLGFVKHCCTYQLSRP